MYFEIPNHVPAITSRGEDDDENGVSFFWEWL
jgi:hypothetical protein